MVVVPGAVVFTPVTNSTGGTSVGDPTAGIADSSDVQAVMTTPATSKDKVAAGFLTFAVMGGILGGGVFMVMDSWAAIAKVFVYSVFIEWTGYFMHWEGDAEFGWSKSVL